MNRFTAMLPIFAFFAIAQPASADLLGTNVNVCWNTVYNGVVTTDTSVCNPVTVGFPNTSAIVTDPGVEFAIGASRQVDFTGTTVSVTYASFSGSASPDLFIFSNLGGNIAGLTLLTSNPLNITTATTSDSLAILVGSPLCCTSSTATVSFQIDFANTSAVPEPTELVVLSSSLLALPFIRRRIRK